MSISPLQLKHIFVTRLLVENNSDYRADADNPSQDVPVVDFEISEHPTRENQIAVAMTVLINSDPDVFVERPHRVELRLLVVFEFGEAIEGSHWAYTPNMIAMAYGEARSIIRAATTFLVDGPVTIPVLNFKDMIERKIAAMQPSLESAEKES